MRLLKVALPLLALTASTGCTRDEPPLTPASRSATAPAAQQAIIDRSAEALASMRASGQFPALDRYLGNAHAVMVFPRLVKAGLLFGGEGGTGVLLTRAADGSWSAPAFYSIGGGSVGLQIGYQEASVVLVLMSQKALRSALGSGVKLGSDVTVAAGTVGDTGDAHRGTTASDIVSFASARGVFAGLSLDGAVISARSKHNHAYYGPGATPTAIVIERRFDRPETAQLRSLLSPSVKP
jgi:lipid-binding SYLF domain-containing protein